MFIVTGDDSNYNHILKNTFPAADALCQCPRIEEPSNRMSKEGFQLTVADIPIAILVWNSPPKKQLVGGAHAVVHFGCD